ncbi:MAG: PDZ domain-containing protein [Candidatus Hydrogenedentota bacterium]
MPQFCVGFRAPSRRRAVVAGAVSLLMALMMAVGGTEAKADTHVPEDTPQALRRTVEEAVDKVKPALVRIQVVTIRYQEGRAQRYLSSGSGVIVSPEGHVVTNHHVAAHAARIKCTLTTKEELDAHVVGADAMTDLAVLKLENEEGREFPSAEFGDSSEMRVGDEVLAMGSPMALSQSVTLGIISNTEMIIPRIARGELTLDGENVGALVRWIGHDAEIHRGNSGGPLVNLDGDIIGINEIQMALGGAIPGNLAKEVADELLEAGEVKRAWLGIQVQPLLHHGAHDAGVLISGAFKDSPAEEAGFQSGDILVELAGESIDVRFDEELPLFNQLTASLTIGEPVTAVVMRGGEEVELEVSPTKREPARPEQQELRRWGLTGRDISFIMARQMQRDHEDGVYVTSVRSSGPAGEARPALSSEDIIVSVNDVSVDTLEELVNTTEEVMEDAEGAASVLATFERNGEERVTVVELGDEASEQPALDVRRAWLPVDTQVLTQGIREQLGHPDLTGFRVTRVLPETTAEEAGLEVGDVILAVDGQRLTASQPEDYEELPSLIRQYRESDEVELTVMRDREEQSIPVELQLSPRPAREMMRYEDPHFEFTARDINYMDRVDQKWDLEQQGVLVEDVRSGSWADLGELSTRDLIVKVNEEPVRDVEGLQRIMENIEAEEPEAVIIQVRRGIGMRFLEIEPRWDEEAV